MESLISLYRRIGPDVLCLQEVQRQDVFDEVARRAGYDGHYTEGSTLRPYGGAMLWRTGRAVETSTQGDGTQRVWQIARCGFLTVCNVHLPSSRQLGAQRAAAQRVGEMGRATRAPPGKGAEGGQPPAGRPEDGPGPAPKRIGCNSCNKCCNRLQ